MGVSLQSIIRDQLDETRQHKDNGRPASEPTRRAYAEYALKQEAVYAGLVEPVDAGDPAAVRRVYHTEGRAWARCRTGLSPGAVGKIVARTG